jgi:hypothetical protein
MTFPLRSTGTFGVFPRLDEIPLFVSPRWIGMDDVVDLPYKFPSMLAGESSPP